MTGTLLFSCSSQLKIGGKTRYTLCILGRFPKTARQRIKTLTWQPSFQDKFRGALWRFDLVKFIRLCVVRFRIVFGRLKMSPVIGQIYWYWLLLRYWCNCDLESRSDTRF